MQFLKEFHTIFKRVSCVHSYKWVTIRTQVGYNKAQKSQKWILWQVSHK